MKKMLLMTTVLILSVSGRCAARDFWSIYGEQTAYNYAIKAGTDVSLTMNNRLTERETLGVVTKSFSQTLGLRFKEIAWSRRGLLIVCAFSPEAERCYMDVVLDATFSEIQFIKTPGFSQRFLLKMRKFYSTSFRVRDDVPGKYKRASRVPPWKSFNPMFGIDLNEFEVVVSTPFYSYFGLYVEPQFGTRNGPSLGLMKNRWSMDIYDDHVAINYKFPRWIKGWQYLKLSCVPGREIRLENMLVSF